MKNCRNDNTRTCLLATLNLADVLLMSSQLHELCIIRKTVDSERNTQFCVDEHNPKSAGAHAGLLVLDAYGTIQ